MEPRSITLIVYLIRVSVLPAMRVKLCTATNCLENSTSVRYAPNVFSRVTNKTTRFVNIQPINKMLLY